MNCSEEDRLYEDLEKKTKKCTQVKWNENEIQLTVAHALATSQNKTSNVAGFIQNVHFFPLGTELFL